MSSPRQKLVVLGATGSIGVSTLDVVARHPDRFEVLALSAQNKIDRLAEQCRQFHPRYAVVGSENAASILDGMLRQSGIATTVLCGIEALERVASLPETDTVMAAIVGAAGLRPTLAAARAGKKILLANKEALVMAGALFMQEVHRNKAILLPIDSEHNAIYQSLPRCFSSDLEKHGVRRIVLTASGGPFRQMPLTAFAEVTPDQACAHPNWSMGRKISVDSATMMNKGLEVIEAHWLFNTPPDRIEVVIHPQSVIHSMVEYADGSVIAQLGNPDMRTPIAYALAYPERIEAGVEPLDLCRIGMLNFERPDFKRFPCLGLAYDVLSRGGNAPAVLNAANEVAVAAFLDGRLPFSKIPWIIQKVLADVAWNDAASLEDIFTSDALARESGRHYVAGLSCRT
ncbi:MAG: 1-deoxy-D-xylulose-5-phosphate reductoisomerase [Zoogloeaceae bacterium]|jgi:1-deoxy-D-xylulose-5-phosphate reductoisomerase|nr:1-deoxy-D-xylulose-5-phosphate reductoisomerase [Zoogloeaceae bacterium]